GLINRTDFYRAKRQLAHRADGVGGGDIVVVGDGGIPGAAAVGQRDRLAAGEAVVVLRVGGRNRDAGLLDLQCGNRNFETAEQNRRRVLNDVVRTVFADQIAAQIGQRQIVETIDIRLRDGVGLNQFQRRVVFAGEQRAPFAALKAAVNIALGEFAAIGIGAVVDIDAVFQFIDGFQIAADIEVAFDADARGVAFQRPVVEFLADAAGACAGGGGAGAGEIDALQIVLVQRDIDLAIN